MSTADYQKRLKEEAKVLNHRIQELITDITPQERMIRQVCIYAGLITETLIDFEEPDVVMEQAFARIADLMSCEPAAVIDEGDLIPFAWAIDHDTELGRHLARKSAKSLLHGIDDVHELAIGLVMEDFPRLETAQFPKSVLLRLLIEMVIVSLTFEMATQDFCDMLIEEHITDGKSAVDAIFGLAVIAGRYYAEAESYYVLPPEAQARLSEVMVREARRHGMRGHKDWSVLAAGNDEIYQDTSKNMEIIYPDIQEFFEMVGLDDPLAKAVAVTKAVGRMVAVVTVEDVGQIHPSIAKSLAKTGMILGSRHKV